MFLDRFCVEIIRARTELKKQQGCVERLDLKMNNLNGRNKNVKVSSKTGTLTIQNRNDFEIVVHLLCEGEQEIVSGNISAGGCYSFANVTDKEYTVGIHADVDAATNIKVIVYDGKDTEPYTN